jgi:hypothetical protein
MTRAPHRLAVRLIAGLLALSLTGCGLTMTTGPDPRRPPDQRPVCTETMDAPKRDAYPAAVGFFAFLVGLLFYKVGDNDDEQDVGAALMLGGGVVTVASYVSGGIGYFRVKRCQKAVDEYNRRLAPPPGPGYYPPPP